MDVERHPEDRHADEGSGRHERWIAERRARATASIRLMIKDGRVFRASQLSAQRGVLDGRSGPVNDGVDLPTDIERTGSPAPRA